MCIAQRCLTFFLSKLCLSYTNSSTTLRNSTYIRHIASTICLSFPAKPCKETEGFHLLRKKLCRPSGFRFKPSKETEGPIHSVLSLSVTLISVGAVSWLLCSHSRYFDEVINCSYKPYYSFLKTIQINISTSNITQKIS